MQWLVIGVSRGYDPGCRPKPAEHSLSFLLFFALPRAPVPSLEEQDLAT
jgi:hypothetical protein